MFWADRSGTWSSASGKPSATRFDVSYVLKCSSVYVGCIIIMWFIIGFQPAWSSLSILLWSLGSTGNFHTEKFSSPDIFAQFSENSRDGFAGKSQWIPVSEIISPARLFPTTMTQSHLNVKPLFPVMMLRLNLRCCHVTGWWDIYVNVQLNAIT